MSPAATSLQISLEASRKAFSSLGRFPRRKSSVSKVERPRIEQRRSVLESTTPLLQRVSTQARRAIGQPISASDFSKIEVEKGILFELAARSVGFSPMSKDAAESLFERDRSSNAIMANVDPRLKKKTQEVVRLAQNEARLERAEEATKPDSASPRRTPRIGI